MGIAERPAGRDPVLAALFRDMREATRLGRDELAWKLRTFPDVIERLEGGELGALPPWKETVRIVEAYGRLLAFDPRPILVRIEGQSPALDAAAGPAGRGMARAAPALAPQHRHAAPRESRQPGAGIHFVASSPVKARPGTTDPPPQRETLARLRAKVPAARALLAVSVPLVLLLALLWLAPGVPGVLRAAVGGMPDAVARPIAAVFGHFSSSRQDGLTWIDVDDPRSRKADKLQSRAP